MKRAIKHTSNVYQYLENSGVLDSGTEEEIVLVRKAYIKQYKTQWRKQKRKEKKEYTVAFTGEELKIITQAANKHNKSNTRYIKESSLLYAKQAFLVPDRFSLNHIREILVLNHTSLQSIEEANIVSTETGQKLLQQFEALEYKIMTVIEHPKTIEDAVREAIRNNPDYKTIISSILETID